MPLTKFATTQFGGLGVFSIWCIWVSPRMGTSSKKWLTQNLEPHSIRWLKHIIYYYSEAHQKSWMNFIANFHRTSLVLTYSTVLRFRGKGQAKTGYWDLLSLLRESTESTESGYWKISSAQHTAMTPRDNVMHRASRGRYIESLGPRTQTGF